MIWIIELTDGTIVTSDKVLCMGNIYTVDALDVAWRWTMTVNALKQPT